MDPVKVRRLLIAGPLLGWFIWALGPASTAPVLIGLLVYLGLLMTGLLVLGTFLAPASPDVLLLTDEVDPERD